VDDVLYVAGEGPLETPVVFITPALEEEATTSSSESIHGFNIKDRPRYLKGGIGSMLREVAGLAGLQLEDFYVTALIKWLLPRALRNRLPKDAVEWAMPALLDELKEIQPKIIVCLGKPAFDQLVPLKINLSDALGGWFWSPAHNARVFLMDKPISLMTHPEKLETFRILFKEVKAMLDRIEGVTTAPAEPTMHFVRNEADLRKMVTTWMVRGIKEICVDCEWGGNNHVSGKLRSIQFGISPTEGYCVTFMNSKKEYTMDISYAEAGKILGMWLNRPDVKYVGHFICADLPWMSHWLNLDWYNKVAFDTAFAHQTVDENSGMGLEVLSMTYSTFGRYDLDLVIWKKTNRFDKDDGYATIPDEILEPYSIYDVLVPLVAMPYRRITRGTLTGEDIFSMWYCAKIEHPGVGGFIGTIPDRLRRRNPRICQHSARNEIHSWVEADWDMALECCREFAAESLIRLGIMVPEPCPPQVDYGRFCPRFDDDDDEN